MDEPPTEQILAELRRGYARGERHLHADHQIPIEQRPDLRLDLDNLRTRCDLCHRRKTLRENSGHQGFIPGRELIVFMGAPGSGKSTYAEHFEYVVTTDELRSLKADRETVDSVFNQAFNVIERHLNSNRTVVFDTTAAHPGTRERALRMARQYGAKATLVVFPTGLDECIARQANRAHPVPEDAVRRVHAEVEAQRDDVRHEGWDVVTEHVHLQAIPQVVL